MKRIKNTLFVLILLVIGFYNVYAKDTVYSISKYKNSYFDYILKSYNLEDNEDGYVMGGNYLKNKKDDDSSYDDYQVMLAKYNKNDKLVWTYNYGDTKEDYIDYLTYTYNENKIDGYLIVTRKTYDIFSDSDKSDNANLLKIDLEGKLVYEKEIDYGIVEKIIPTYDQNNVVVGYISIINKDNRYSLVRFDNNFETVWKKDYSDELIDISRVYDNSVIKGYAIIKKTNDNAVVFEIDLDGNNETIVNDNLNEFDSYKLVESNNGFIIYGVTSDVKLKKGESSFYLINYYNNSLVWETIGNEAVSLDDTIILLPVYKDNKIDEYLLLYKNGIDSSYEVIKIDLDGVVGKKIKKIKNNYYTFKDFYSSGNVIYFVGQLNCPEDENCDYVSNFLYLVSDEDKVIEVEDNTSKGILVFVLGFIAIGVLAFVIRGRIKNKQ